ncbi:D-glycero-beta-D-manno-heptose 1,7-bisphosphate 7-phosphatase [Ideonella sp. DXS22W]|uniref:D,D-heptose 1,7-bisphosphate phosphatase n=1 Tax=Pseudaquabacterium inlustre TaxID=2984192 RepID=A0ABU9CNF8_9BURK
MAEPLRRAVFLDRDGVINTEVDYLHRIADFAFVPGTPQALARLQAAGWALVVVTNQSGIARGYYTEADYQALTAHIRAELARHGVTLDAVLHCPHLPDATVAAYRQDCDCRKPAPGMILHAAAELGLDLPASVIVGDKGSDLQAGRAAGVGYGVLVRSGHAPKPADEAAADAVHDSLAHWVDHLLAQPAGR